MIFKKVFISFPFFVSSVLLSIVSGSLSGLFLLGLEYCQFWRDEYPVLLFLLPLFGLIIVFGYENWGKEAQKGNRLVHKEIEKPEKMLPLMMAPLVLLGTWLTHLGGGSAGREGTAVQIGATMADLPGLFFKFSEEERSLLLRLGVCAGFSSVFGTPFAAILFAMEVVSFKRLIFFRVPYFLGVAFLTDWVCRFWPITHVHYPQVFLPELSWGVLVWGIFYGFCFAGAGFLFYKSSEIFTKYIKRWFPNPYLRVSLGGVLLVLIIYFFGLRDYSGLGVPFILDSFSKERASYVFLLKLLLTTFTLSVGFKGGEVTPLFFVGATLGSFLSSFSGLPLEISAALGFVSVFSAATNTPMASAVMGMEIFGIDAAPFFLISSFLARYVSGSGSIYK